MVGDALCLVSPEELGEAKVRDLRVHVGVKQDVASFEIAMHYFELGVLVEVLHASSDSVYNLVSLSPVKLLAFLGVYATVSSENSIPKLKRKWRELKYSVLVPNRILSRLLFETNS
jgi:hypothetical protein